MPDRDISVLQKPDKVYLDSPNLAHTLQLEQVDRGSLRETFFASQLAPRHTLHLHRRADFLIDHHYVIEVGGKGKSARQTVDTPHAYRALDDLEIDSGDRIPLWLFGMLY